MGNPSDKQQENPLAFIPFSPSLIMWSYNSKLDHDESYAWEAKLGANWVSATPTSAGGKNEDRDSDNRQYTGHSEKCHHSGISIFVIFEHSIVV